MTRFRGVASDYYHGHKISDYGIENKRVDYRTFASSFDAVLNNDIMALTDGVVGYWEQIGGFCDNSYEINEITDSIDNLEEQIEKLEEQIENCADSETKESFANELSELEDKKAIFEEELENLENEQDELPEIYQWFIVGDNAVSILEENNEIVFYNSQLDMYLWGVTHWGTAWDYVLTDIPCMVGDKAYEL